MGLWLVTLLVTVRFATDLLSGLLHDWRFYLVVAASSVVCFLITRERAQRRGGDLERTPHDPSHRHRSEEGWE